MVRHPHLEVAQRAALRHLRGELHAELRLPAGALEKQHQPARDLARHPRSQVVGHEREREVDARRDASGGPHALRRG